MGRWRQFLAGRILAEMRLRWILFLMAIVLACAGCGSLPADVPRATSYAIPAARDSDLGSIAAVSVSDSAMSGFRLIPTPEFSLHARIELTLRAQHSLDLQYYELHNDQTGRYVLRLVRDAAARGVRVRLLLDDLHTSDEDRLLVALAAHDNIEIRLFNPYPYRGGSLFARYASSLTDFGRLNHRMHNKLFIADGAMAVVGGRNIGDEYFLRDAGANFIDLDTLVAGALLPRLGSLFDEYWNSSYAYPIGTIVRIDGDQGNLRAWFDRETEPRSSPPPDPPPDSDLLGHEPIGREMARGKLMLTLAGADAFADAPDKVARPRGMRQGEPNEEQDSVLYNVRKQVRDAREEVAETTPYLVPGREGMESMRQLRERGVKFSIVTNSLAAIDEVAVYTGYRRYRPEMLRLGVELYELSPDRVRRNAATFGKYGPSFGRLHAKSAVIDRRTVFIGSLNFDPRSDQHNTEFGLFIYSTVLANELLRLMDYVKVDGSYRLRLSASGSGIEWVVLDGGIERVLSDEPEADSWKRLLLDVLTPFVPESLL
jgi:putative cardiolipin synthase